MAKVSKKYSAALAQVDRTKLYSIEEDPIVNFGILINREISRD